MLTRRPLAGMFMLALVLTCLMAFSGVALAQDEGTTIAEGFNFPMGVLVDPNGDIWVIDSGLGGDETIVISSPETGEPLTATYGLSSHIVKVSVAEGTIEDVATLASVAVPGAPEASGGSRLALLDGVLYATVGDWHSAAVTDTTPPAGIAVINRIGEDGAVEQVYEGWPHERDTNPDGALYNTHPYGLLGGADGKLWVADAASNAIYSVDPATGEVADLTVIDPLSGVFPRPEYGGEMLTDAVPTSVAVKDGGLYVSLLSGVPFVPGSAKVLSIAEDGTVSDYATGLTMLTDLRTGPDGELYAVNIGAFGPEGPIPNSGNLIRVQEGDASVIVVGGLSFPSSVDFDADGNAYITTNAIGAPGSGQVLRFDGVTEAEGEPYAAMLGEMMAAMAQPADASAAMTDTAATAEGEAASTETAAMTEAPAASGADAAAEGAGTDAPAAAESAATETTAEPAQATEAPAPETLPVTGNDAASNPALLTAALALLALAGLAWMMRRRTT